MVAEQVAEKLYHLQPRCIVCGSTYALHKHHRIFQGEGDAYLQKWLEVMIPLYEQTYGRKLEFWHIDDIQNLAMVCIDCHEGNAVGVHAGNETLNQKLRASFTHPLTGFNVPFNKVK
jgi:hypothetical protein